MGDSERLDKLEKDVKRLRLWQDAIIGELDSVSSTKHAYYSSFSLDTANELKKGHPELFSEENKDDE